MDVDRRITKWDVLKYALLPQIMPRISNFSKGGFINLAYLVAQVYASINLLPRNHPIFLPGNKQNLTLRYVIACAAQQLKFSRSHIDQIIVFFAILVGVVLLALQFILFLGFLMISPSFAQDMPQNYGEFFMEADQKNDIAYRMLFTVFGIPELFKEGGARSEYHIALHSLFQLYSIGILVIAVIIVCYYIFAVLAETAQTGVPFGKRYNHVWTPIRLVVGLGLLIPVGYGLNSAQWITLYSAKFGSDFATKGWVLFNETMNGAYLDDVKERVGTPKVPDVKAIPAFMMLTVACKHAYEKAGLHMDIAPYILSNNSATAPAPTGAPSYATEDTKYKYDMVIRFGVKNTDKENPKHNKEPDGVFPYCGELVISKTDKEPGSQHMRQVYFDAIIKMYEGDIPRYAKGMVDKYMEVAKKDGGAAGEDPPSDFKDVVQKDLEEFIEKGIEAAVEKQANSPTWKNDIEAVKKYGWGGAGIWYNKIAQINGSLVTAINTVPQVRRMPSTMEYIRNEAIQQNRNVGDPFTDALADDIAMKPEMGEDGPIGKILLVVYRYWSDDDRSHGPLANQTKMTGNMVIDVINAVFGTQGLFAMCQNTDTHPLAQLSLLGKGLVEASIRNIMAGVGFGVAQMIIPAQMGAFMGAASGMLFSIASITLVMGFMLFYVLPFMPFLYFFFAVGGWIKGLFEAMVGLPLWALAHLRIDGEGLPGSAGMDGYYLIFEIFLRPILIVFGLLASVVIFAAMVKVLNEIFHLVVQNLSGHDPNGTTMCGANSSTGTSTAAEGDPIEFFRGPIDELFYTVLYAIVVYMIGMSCFKLIDLVPNNILRYMGVTVNTFNDKAADPTEGLMRNLSVGGSMVSGKILGDGGIVPSLTSGVGGLKDGVIEATKPPPETKAP